jgi:hypothetical protein
MAIQFSDILQGSAKERKRESQRETVKAVGPGARPFHAPSRFRSKGSRLRDIPCEKPDN